MRLMTVTDGHGSSYTPSKAIPHVRPVGILSSLHSGDNDAQHGRARFVHSRVAGHTYQQAADPEHERGRMIYAHQIMTSPVAMISPEATLNDVWTLMCEHRFRHVPVSEDGVHLKGMLSDRDLLRHAPAITGNTMGKLQPAEHKTISEIMTRVVLAASPEIEIREVARTMFKERIGSLPLLNADQSVAGIITRSDILRVFMNNAPLDLWS